MSTDITLLIPLSNIEGMIFGLSLSFYSKLQDTIALYILHT